MALPFLPKAFSYPGRTDPRPERGAATHEHAQGHARLISRAICCLLLLISAISIGIEYWGRSLAYNSQIQQSRVAGQNIAQASIEHLDATLHTVTWMLDGIVERVEADGTFGAGGERLRRFLLTRVQKKDSPLQGLFIYDRTGAWLLTTFDRVKPGANNADRAYFRYHQANADRGIHIGAPVISHSSGEWILTVSRRLNDKDGNFAGVALATIPVSYFQRYYERMSLGRQGAVLLAMNDGTVVTRTPMAAGVVGSSIRGTPFFQFLQKNSQASGSIMLMTRYDQVERLQSFRRSSTYPLLVNAALAKDEFLADWRRVTLQEVAAVASLMGIVHLAGFWLIRQTRARERLETTLRDTQAVLEEQNAALARLAHTDGLTGLYNRRSFDARMADEWARAAREGNALSLVMIDVDFFKRYNDHYGHAAGDDCLRAVAVVLASSVNRPADMAARYGGEEFALLLPNTTRAGAQALAEAICRQVWELRLAHGPSDFGVVTISAGVATLVPQAASDGRALIEAADRGLYEAKKAGRATVRAA